MKRILLLALCALFAVQADARTLYVNASRPNNSGNGLSAKKAKKTIQAAINVAKKGDTILVYPGTYAPIKTNNKKIAIKSVKGQKKTKILANGKLDFFVDLSKHVRKHNAEYDYDYTDFVGNETTLSGFLLDGGKDEAEVSNGSLKSCKLQNVVEYGGFYKSKLSNCLVQNNVIYTGGTFFYSCSVSRTVVTSLEADGYAGSDISIAADSTFANCLFYGNKASLSLHDYDSGTGAAFFGSTFLNCTIAENEMTHRNRASMFASGCKFYNCILRNNRSRLVLEEEWNGETGQLNIRTDPARIHNADAGNVYKNTDKTNKNPKFANAAKGDYKLKKGSYCINSGKLSKAQKTLVGTTDLAGKKRIKGKAVDRGCYEY